MKTESEVRKAAQAFWELSEGKNTLEFETELQEVVEALNSLPELKEALITQKIAPEKKLEIFSRAFRGKISNLTFGFLSMLIEIGLVEKLALIVKEYSRLRSEKEGKLTAEVTTAQPLDDDLKAEISRALSKAAGKEVILKCRVDESILGGIIIRLGDRLIDGSLKSRLSEAKLTFAYQE